LVYINKALYNDKNNERSFMQNAIASELLRVSLKVTLCDQNLSAKKVKYCNAASVLG